MRRVNRVLSSIDQLLERVTVALFGPDGVPRPPAVLPTGSPALDDILGGGLPRARLTELYGPPGSGKSTLALMLIAHAQRAGHQAALVDAENAFVAGRAVRLGVVLDQLRVLRPRTGEEALAVVERLLGEPEMGVVVVDSVAALLPRAELAHPAGEAPAGLHARMMSQGLRRLASVAAESRAAVLFLNQTRVGFDEAGRAMTTTSGGQALHFYAAARLEVLHRPDGLRVCVHKSRVGPEGAVAFVPLPPLSPLPAAAAATSAVTPGVVH